MCFRRRGELFRGIHVIHGCLYNQALADVQLTGAGIQWLDCNLKVENDFSKELRKLARAYEVSYAINSVGLDKSISRRLSKKSRVNSWNATFDIKELKRKNFARPVRNTWGLERTFLQTLYPKIR